MDGVRHLFKGGFPVGRSGKIIVFITILAVAAFAYVYISAQLGATLVSIEEENAALRPELFESVMEALNNGDFASNQFSVPDDVSAENYSFVTYTVQLQGVNPLPAEWAILTLAPFPETWSGAGRSQTIPLWKDHRQRHPAHPGPHRYGAQPVGGILRAGQGVERRRETRMILVVAEKPSVARDIARVLGCSVKGDGFLSGKDYHVTWALGHLVGLCDPAEVDPRYKKWDFATLPILPETLPTKVLPKTRKQYGAVKKLTLDPEVTDHLRHRQRAGRGADLPFHLPAGGLPQAVDRLWIPP